MRPIHKKKALDAVKRLNGLTRRLEQMIEHDAYCPKVLEMALAMQGHVRHIQSEVLESHLHTCAAKHLSSKKNHGTFIRELLNAIGLSKR